MPVRITRAPSYGGPRRSLIFFLPSTESRRRGRVVQREPRGPALQGESAMVRTMYFMVTALVLATPTFSAEQTLSQATKDTLQRMAECMLAQQHRQQQGSRTERCSAAGIAMAGLKMPNL